MEKLPPERKDSCEVKSERLENPVDNFSILAARILKVSKNELQEQEQKERKKDDLGT